MKSAFHAKVIFFMPYTVRGIIEFGVASYDPAQLQDADIYIFLVSALYSAYRFMTKSSKTPRCPVSAFAKQEIVFFAA